MAVVTFQDVATSLGRPITDQSEVDQVSQWIDDAELLIRVRLGDLSALDQAILAYVVREAVIAKVRNPEGYQSETVDDYTYRWGASSGRVTILDEWWHMLSPDGGSGAFSIRPFYEADRTDPPWWTTA